jgi:tetratricopeptide (TPR) repeat protein
VALADNAVSVGDYKAAYDWMRKLDQDGKANANDLNSAAWYALFFKDIDNTDLDIAQRAVEKSPKDADYLHTLACLYATIGKVKEARDLALRAMEMRALESPDGNYWYTFARIAEQYGERDTAIEMYRKVTKPELDARLADSTYRLAQDRLKALNAGTAP